MDSSSTAEAPRRQERRQAALAFDQLEKHKADDSILTQLIKKGDDEIRAYVRDHNKVECDSKISSRLTAAIYQRHTPAKYPDGGLLAEVHWFVSRTTKLISMLLKLRRDSTLTTGSSSASDSDSASASDSDTTRSMSSGLDNLKEILGLKIELAKRLEGELHTLKDSLDLEIESAKRFEVEMAHLREVRNRLEVELAHSQGETKELEEEQKKWEEEQKKWEERQKKWEEETKKWEEEKKKWEEEKKGLQVALQAAKQEAQKKAAEEEEERTMLVNDVSKLKGLLNQYKTSKVTLQGKLQAVRDEEEAVKKNLLNLEKGLDAISMSARKMGSRKQAV